MLKLYNTLSRKLEELEKKTKGNLSVDEANMLSSLLYDLRLKFVEARR